MFKTKSTENRLYFVNYTTNFYGIKFNTTATNGLNSVH